MPKLYTVTLTDSERTHLRALIRSGRGAARMLTRARILLLADDGRSDLQIAHSLQCGHATVERLRRRCVADGLLAALQERPRPGAQPKLDGKREALLVALACSEPPTDRAEWTMQLLADKLVAIGASTPFRTKPCAACSKKRSQAVAEAAVVRGDRRR